MQFQTKMYFITDTITAKSSENEKKISDTQILYYFMTQKEKRLHMSKEYCISFHQI